MVITKYEQNNKLFILSYVNVYILHRLNHSIDIDYDFNINEKLSIFICVNCVILKTKVVHGRTDY